MCLWILLPLEHTQFVVSRGSEVTTSVHRDIPFCMLQEVVSLAIWYETKAADVDMTTRDNGTYKRPSHESYIQPRLNTCKRGARWLGQEISVTGCQHATEVDRGYHAAKSYNCPSVQGEPDVSLVSAERDGDTASLPTRGRQKGQDEVMYRSSHDARLMHGQRRRRWNSDQHQD